MTQQSEDELLNDHELGGLIDQLRPVPNRDSEAAKRGRAKFLTEVDAIVNPNPTSYSSVLLAHFPFSISRKKEVTRVNPQKRFVFSVLALMVLFALILFGGAGATAFAAQAALPGDALYPIKTGIEQTQVSLARDAYEQAQLHLAFAEHRLQEISSLIKEGRFAEIAPAAGDFEVQIQQAINALQTVAAGDTTRAKMLAGQITRTLSEYSQNLSAMMANVPVGIQPSMQRAIQASQGSNLSPFDENNNLNENENINNNINLNENENENENEDINSNSNLNTNQNENENLNDNENDNGELDNANLNSNLNSNINMNEDQGNHNSNEEEHNSNSNLNENHNSNDDHEGNFNNNTNTNHNDNGDPNDNGGD